MADTYQYCLRWLQAAVAGGALCFNWTSSARSVFVEIDGLVLEPARLAQLPSLLLDPAASRAEQHLAAGLNAAISTRMNSVRLCSGNTVVV